MEVVFTRKADEDLRQWKKTGNKAIQSKIIKLIDDIEAHPFHGIGKPEPLKYQLAGKWSRRINQEHRMIYELKDDRIVIHSLIVHYY